MNRILFLTYDYPYGHFGPSDNCSLRIMSALANTGKYEVHNISYSGNVANYPIDKGIITHSLPFPERKRSKSRLLIHLRLLVSIPIYPIVHLFSCYRLYRATRKLILGKHFELVVCQCNPEESLWTGTWLKKRGHIEKLMVIFWDNVYGKLPRRVIPQEFAICRQRKAESFVAKYADHLVSLYPIKAFHEKFGEIPQAIGKRTYLGIPSVICPKSLPVSNKREALVQGKINILYSGTIFRESYVEYLVDLLDTTPISKDINLIFFQRGISSSKWDEIKKKFKGSVYVSDWIPLEDLLALYPDVDFFMSYPGNPTSICSKLYEYVSYGKPLLILFDDDSDVNIATFSVYPVCCCIDVRRPIENHSFMVSGFIQANKGCCIPFEKTQSLFIKDSPYAYVNLIDNMMGH